MKKFFLLFILFLAFSFNSFSQENNYKEYSYTEFFTMIENEKDSVFRLNDAIIIPNLKTDKKYFPKRGEKDSKIDIYKEIILYNVQFSQELKENPNKIWLGNLGLNNITFHKSVTIISCFRVDINNCVFKEKFQLSNTGSSRGTNPIVKFSEAFESSDITINNNKFYNSTSVNNYNPFNSNLKQSSFILMNNDFFSIHKNTSVNITLAFSDFVAIHYNRFASFGEQKVYFEECKQATITKNTFTNGIVTLYATEIDEFAIDENDIKADALLDVNIYNNLAMIGISQFKKSINSLWGIDRFKRDKKIPYQNQNHDSILQAYQKEYQIQNEISFNHEVEQRSEFYNYYKNKFNTKEANKYYVDIKNLETRRLEYLYGIDPTFKTFFTWKTNQFLKVFSAYGTEPSRAIIYSVYVILIFGFIYLFFPNTWDSHGKNRIIDRYNFFFKYMKRKAGIHEVYLEDQKEELMSYEAFKKTITASENKVPKFFTATALPMYKWAISGTKLSAAILQRIDIVKGTWSELSPNKRLGKSILLIGAFLIAIIYDITIKILNALMLSINTFTTLGFGEIPIKGLPRYLAIIQGFIGWFMLTIFSVSLISQLLN